MESEVATPPIATGIRHRIYTRFCDWKFGISTRGLIEAQELGLANADCRGYSALEYQFLHWVFPLIPFDPAEVVFLDYGAGKGRALAVAAAQPFRKVIGVEISEDLARIARRNLARMKRQRACQVEVHCSDAAFFPVPADANVYFFFNPFGGDTLIKVIHCIHQSWCTHPRDLFVIFFNHGEFDQYIQEQTWLQKVHETASCGLYRTIYTSPANISLPSWKSTCTSRAVLDGINELRGKAAKPPRFQTEGFTGFPKAISDQEGARPGPSRRLIVNASKGQKGDQKMRTTFLTVGALALSLLGTGCVATHKYVAKTVAPVEQRVGAAETKNTDQDKQLAGHTTEIADLDKDLSQTKEKLRDTDAKAMQAGEAARMADQKATTAQQSAEGAKQAADGARTFAEQGLNKLDLSMQSMNKFQVAKEDAVLFDFNKDTLTPEGKAKLDDLAKQASRLDRYVIELQGFTDKSGSPTYNEALSEARVQAVARYLANEHQIPVRSISMLGAGYARPVADDKTREGRKMNRRVEVRLWVPESQSKTVASNGASQ